MTMLFRKARRCATAISIASCRTAGTAPAALPNQHDEQLAKRLDWDHPILVFDPCERVQRRDLAGKAIQLDGVHQDVRVESDPHLNPVRKARPASMARWADPWRAGRRAGRGANPAIPCAQRGASHVPDRRARYAPPASHGRQQSCSCPRPPHAAGGRSRNSPRILRCLPQALRLRYSNSSCRASAAAGTRNCVQSSPCPRIPVPFMPARAAATLKRCASMSA